MARMTKQNDTKQQRSCVGCGKRDNKSALWRVVRTSTGEVFCDPSGKAAGRGAYVCSAHCLMSACKTKKLDRALRTQLSEDDYKRIQSDFAHVCYDVAGKIGD